MTNAAKGAEFLDEVLPKWYSLVDLTKLKMSSSTMCILRQLEQHIPIPDDYDLYEEAIDNLDDPFDIAVVKLDIDYEVVEYGFTGGGDDELQEEWLTEINRRLMK